MRGRGGIIPPHRVPLLQNVRGDLVNAHLDELFCVLQTVNGPAVHHDALAVEVFHDLLGEGGEVNVTDAEAEAPTLWSPDMKS